MAHQSLKILGYTFEEITKYINKEFGKSEFHASGICREIFKKGNIEINRAKEFNGSEKLALKIKNKITIDTGRVSDVIFDGNTTKYTTILNDGLKVESVLVPMKNYTTLCISSQVGCRLGCVFCETGKNGFIRNLKAEEIVGQLYNANFHLKNKSIKNIVFMGMGEPLDNTENVIKAVEIFSDQRCFNIARKNITLSTVGIPDQLQLLGSRLNPAPNLAVSLNSAVDQIRSEIMPVNKKHPLEDLKNGLLSFPFKKNSSIFFGYVLMEGINDSYNDAQALIEFLTPFRARVNIIPFNQNSCEGIISPSYANVKKFSGWLSEKSIFVRMRTSKGNNLMAACGQLGQNIKKACQE